MSGAFVGVPLLKLGRVEAVLGVHDDRRRAWSSEDIALIQLGAERTWDALAQARAEAEIRRSEQLKTFMLALTDALRPLTDATALHETVTRMTRARFAADRCYYCELDRGEAIIRRDDRREGLPSVTGNYPMDEFPLFKAVVDAGRPFVADDVRSSNILDEELRRLCIQMGILSFVDVPVIRAGEAVGILCITQCTPRSWTDGEIDMAVEAAERTAAAVARARTEKALRQSEEKLRTLFDTMAEGFAVLELVRDPAGAPVDYVAVELNQAFERQAGITRGDLLGRRTTEVFAPSDVEPWLDAIAKSVATREPVVVDGEFRPLDRWFEFSVYPMTGDRVSAFYRDVTTRRRAELALAAANERLLEADRRKDEFLAMLGHELRNPLSAICSAAEIMRQVASADLRLQRASGVMERQSKQMTRLVDGLLDVSRIARGKIHLERETLDARVVAEAVLQDRDAEARARGIELIRDLPGESVWVEVDRVRMVEILDNLLGNAIKFTGAGGQVRLTLREEAESAVFCVHDTGVGMRPEMLHGLFEPFKQERQDLARSTGGLGLGLAVAKGLAVLQGGTIEAHSAGLGAGSELRVRLPIATTRAPAPGGRKDAVSARRILVVEDNPDASQSLRDLLDLLGHDVEVAMTGPSALASLSVRPVDLVLCDLGLPGMSGFDVARAIRSDPRMAGTRVVALTGYGNADDRRRSREAGFDAHLVKPATLEKLTEVLSGLRADEA